VAVKAVISIGSNIGERIGNCRRAIEALAEADWATLLKESSFYETEPWGKTGQPDFINCAVLVETELAPLNFLEKLKEIEFNIGRTQGEKWGPRLIDLDIVIYGDVVTETERLTLPHRHAHERAFVMVPAAEVAPELSHPTLKKNVREIAAGIARATEVRRVEKC